MNRLSFRSVKSQLFVMVFIMAFFAAGIIVYSGVSFRNEKISEALKDSAMLAESLSNEHEKMVADIRQLMLTLAQLPDIRNLNAAGMQRILKEVLGANPKYSNIFIADTAGKVLASAAPAKDTNVSDRRYFVNALATGRFSSGEFIISKFTGKPVLAFGYPFKDGHGKILGVIVMGIDMRYYKTLLDTMPLPSGSSYLLLDHKGTIMTRGINPLDFVGEQYETPGFKRMTQGRDKDTFVAIAHDGIKRFISYRKIRLAGEQTPYLYIRAGIPVATALSVANKTLMRNLILFTASLGFVIVVISILAKHSIIDRIALLEKASKRLADGDMHFKVSDLISGGELGRLGSTFDHMACQIASRERALNESKQRYHTLFEQSPYGVLLLDTEGKILDFNETAHRDLGYTREEFANLTIADINPFESAVDVKTHISRILEAGRAEFEVRHRTKQGEIRDVDVITKVLTLSEQTLLHSIWRDITARKQAEEEIMKLNRDLQRRAAELESSYKDMESFSYAASHDLKAPVIRIAGFSDILLQDYAGRLDEYGRECLNRILDNTGKMRKLIEDLLDFSSISAKEILKSSIDMESLTKSAYEETKPAGERNIQIQIAALPSACGDPSLIRQVLLNLLANAIKFTKTRQTAKIEVGGRTEKDENIYYVRDNGTGFDMQFVHKLFGLFQRVHISEEFEGTGIGLVIVKRIIEKHGGRVWAEGKPNKGATFYFSLPKREAFGIPGCKSIDIVQFKERTNC